MNDVPFCSVIVPTRGRPDQLRDCLESLAQLEHPRERYEVIVVDDGGSLVPATYVDAFSERLDLMMLSQRRSGPAAARNAGAAKARGQLLAFTDDDCLPDRPWLAQLVAAFEENPQTGVGGHTVNSLTDNPYAAASQLVIDVGYGHHNVRGGDARFLTTNNLAVPAAGFRDVGGFDVRFRTSEDRDFCARWVAHGLRLAYVPDAIVRHAHRLTFGGFIRQNFAYGRGAYLFHREQARRWQTRIRLEPSFYRALVRTALRRERGMRRLQLLALLGVWQLANAAGFAWESTHRHDD